MVEFFSIQFAPCWPYLFPGSMRPKLAGCRILYLFDVLESFSLLMYVCFWIDVYLDLV